MKKLSILFSLLIVAGLNVAWGQCSDLFFSEYVEGSSNNKALEIFNPTTSAINLSGYVVYRYGNGSATATDTFMLSGMVGAGDVHVLANDGSDPAILAVADDSIGFPGIITFNGDDAMALINENTGDTLDIFGIIGNDPGFFWNIGMGDSTQNSTLVRMPGVTEGTTDWAVGGNQWISSPSNTFDSLDFHTSTCNAPVGPGPADCSELFFSEYIEGSGNNKGIEIYNPSDNPIDLSDYRIVEYGNGGSFQDTLDLMPFGMLAAGEVLVLTTDQADPIMLAQSDSAFSFPSINHFNGDDALVLLKLSTGDTLDIFGIVGVDPGNVWPVGTGDSTRNITLVRMPDVNAGSADWAVVSQQWLAFPINTFDSLGSHTMTPCSTQPVTGDPTNCSTEIFFSEYIEGSSNNKALEIFNPMDAMVNLDNYEIHRFNNGGTLANDIFELSGMLPGSEVYVVGNSGADSVILAEKDTTGAATFYNGNDAMVLINTMSGDTVDIIGVIGENPSPAWPVDTGSTQNYTLVRMASVNEGTTDWALGATQWIVLPQDTYDSLGSHTMTPCPPVTNCTTELFFSEYIEGSSNNKALEIFNPTEAMVDLEDYEIHRYNNGATTSPDIFELSGMLAGSEVYVVANASADSLILVEKDTTGSPTFYNGNDALLLINTANTDTVDIIGVVGENPSPAWPVDTGSTQEYTLVRMASVNEGATDWGLSASQWLVFPQNTFDSLGAHTMDPCPPVVPTVLSFSPSAATVGEDVGTASFSVVVANPSPGDSSAVDVMFNATASTATLGTDFTWTDTTVVFAAGATAPVVLSVDVVDDADIEGDEIIVVDLMNATNGALIGGGTLTVTIQDNDFNAYPIGLITADSAGDGLADSLNVVCQIQGIVHGIDLQGGGSVQFTTIDSTGGIGTFSGNDFGYTVVQGDEVIIQGEVTAFNGLSQMTPSNIILVSSGNSIVTPLSVTQLDETTESELITLECVTIIDTTQWPSASTAGSANIDVTNGVDTFAVRIDSDTELRGTPAPLGKWLNITGIGGQFDGSFPHLDGYQLLPNFNTDVVERPDPTVGFAVMADTSNEGTASVAVEIQQMDGNPDATMVSVELDVVNSTATLGTDFTFADTTIMITGCGMASAMLDVAVIDDADVESDETIVMVITTASNNATITVDTLTLTIEDNDTDGIGAFLPAGSISMYPNPATDRLVIEASLDMERLAIYNVVGQEVMGINRPDRMTEMGIAHLPKGIYTLRVITQEGVWMQKWVKK